MTEGNSIRAGRARDLILAAILTALALGLSLIDTAVSSVLAFVPGMKLGLANTVSLLALYYMGLPWALGISFIRCVLGSVFSGQITAFLFSVMGGMGSLLVMAAMKRLASVIKTSTAGGVAHNLLQLCAAGLVTATPALVNYAPVLIAAGTVTGFGIGILCTAVFARLPRSADTARGKHASTQSPRHANAQRAERPRSKST